MSVATSSPGAVGTAFDAYYADKIAPDLEALEGRRRRAAIVFCVLSGTGLVATLVMLSAGPVSRLTGLSVYLVSFGSLGVMAVTLLRAAVVYFSIHRPFQKILVERVAAYLGLDYQRDGFDFPHERFEDAGLVGHYGRARLEDRVSGEHKGVRFALCEGRLLQRAARSSMRSGTSISISVGNTDLDDDMNSKLVFRGLLLIYSFPKRYTGKTIVVPDETWLGDTLRGLRVDGERVRLEDRRFEKRFQVYSSDQVEARYLLTPRFMECLCELDDLFGAGQALCLAFHGSDLLIAIRTAKDHFEGGGLFTPFTDRARVNALLREFALLPAIADILHLSRGRGSGAS